MILGYNINGGGENVRKFKIGISFPTAGVPAIMSATLPGVVLPSTTVAADAIGVTTDTGTYSTTQGDAEGLVSVMWRPDNVYKALMSGAAVAGTALVKLVNTVASTTGLVVTDADVGTADMDGGSLYCIKGANLSQSRVVTTHTSGVSVAVTVPFLNDIAVDDEFILVPYADVGTGAAGADGNSAVQLTTDLTGANAIIASGTGINVVVVEVYVDPDDPTTKSLVLFKLADHVYDINTI